MLDALPNQVSIYEVSPRDGLQNEALPIPLEGKKQLIQALIDAESPVGDRRARMIASFNRGYRGFQQTYRTCTPAAELVIRRYLEEGAKIAREVTARYAN